jgi:hypothetical protein
MEQQLAVMRSIGASEGEFTYAKAESDGHYITNAVDWQEYNNRKW